MIARLLACAALALGLANGCSASTAGAPRERAAALPAAPAATTAPATGAPSVAAAPAPRISGDRQIVHVLSRLTYGPRPGDVERVRAMGVSAWIDRQLRPQTIDDSATERALAELTTLRMPIAEALREFPRPDPKLRAQIASGEMSRQAMLERYPMEKRPARITMELQRAKVLRAVTSERQLEEIMVDFWFNHFNVFAGKGDVRWYVSSYERDAIRPYALGRFPDLVRATAYHPAMLFYLDNWLSAKPDFIVPGGPNRGRRAGLNENYARELMELHTLGVDGGYTQHDVIEVARALTGWSLQDPRAGGGFFFRPDWHDAEAKVVLGHVLGSGHGIEDGERVLDFVARHPSTARFVAAKLVRRFVSDSAPPALVGRAAATFAQTDGDIRQVLVTIVTSHEFYSRAAYRSKVKTPFELVVSTMRALGATADTTPHTAQLVGRLGQPVFGRLTPDGWPDQGAAWMNTGAILERINFGMNAAAGRVPGMSLDRWPLAPSLRGAPLPVQVDGVIAALFGGDVSTDTREILTSGRNPLGTTGDMAQAGRASMAPAPLGLPALVGLALGAPEFQRR
jgi:uncharacterized protein (DUF1800 family)